MKKAVLLLVLLTFCVHAQEVGKDSAIVDSSVVNIEQKRLLLTVVSWPFVNIVQPTMEFLMYPLIPPLLYISRENLIEKGINLVTFGEKKNIMIYPTISAKPGSSSNVGLNYRHSDIFFDNDNLVISPRLYVNEDLNIAARYKKSNILGSSFYLGLEARLNKRSDYSFIDLDRKYYYYTDSSYFFNTYTGFNLTGNWGLEFAGAANLYRFDEPEINEEVSDSEYAKNRGFYQSYQTYPLTVSLLYNSLDFPYAPTKGNKFNLSYSYVNTSRYNNSKEHNYHVAESRLVNYKLLGNKNYAMTVAESEINREKLKNLTFREAVEMFNPINIREEVLDRRVLVTQLKLRYIIEENNGKAPFTAMGRLGGNFPLRAYDDGYFTAPLVAGISNEYRWPIDRLAEALIFNEYGIYAQDFNKISLSKFNNSYGFGIRVRSPNLFIARLEFAFHGMHGISVILTTTADYE